MNRFSGSEFILGGYALNLHDLLIELHSTS